MDIRTVVIFFLHFGGAAFRDTFAPRATSLAASAGGWMSSMSTRLRWLRQMVLQPWRARRVCFLALNVSQSVRTGITTRG
ncbi:hypothetical protein GW15_0217425 [Xanthomonas axonopodis pv. vasculorum]|uniref:Uncharacterized protein n=1 Tax=Xanthomonas axonopodis pv. vasculorum TaxID=325777 RepID=A0A098PWB4_9XANT|nr:hypothetical protein GW15_0217425 [Xanthomonas axonopodis pv. vasculorum]PPV09930.1 hypothetical protein XavaCFBP5823_11965 [Xanthomonas axonopodis pv. vasculorum]